MVIFDGEIIDGYDHEVMVIFWWWDNGDYYDEIMVIFYGEMIMMRIGVIIYIYYDDDKNDKYWLSWDRHHARTSRPWIFFWTSTVYKNCVLYM
jgi:hypothetical protein